MVESWPCGGDNVARAFISASPPSRRAQSLFSPISSDDVIYYSGGLNDAQGTHHNLTFDTELNLDLFSSIFKIILLTFEAYFNKSCLLKLNSLR